MLEELRRSLVEYEDLRAEVADIPVLRAETEP